MSMSRETATLLNFLPDPMVIVSGDGIMLCVNEAFGALFGIKADQLKGRSMASCAGIPEAEIRNIIHRCSRTGAPLPFAAHVRSPQGELIRCRLQGALLERGDSKDSTRVWLRLTTHVSATEKFARLNNEISSLKREIVARKEMEQALRRSEEELSEFFENANVGLHWVGPDGSIMRVNRHELQMLGYTQGEYVGHSIADFHVDQSVIEDILSRLKSGEVLQEYPARLRCKDGSVRHVLINSSVLFENGTFHHTRCITHDITDRRRAEEALRASEARYRHLIHSLPAAVYVCDQRGRITLYNQAAAVLWGREPEVGKDLWCGSWAIYRPDGTPLPLDECPMAVALREGRPVLHQEIMIERPDGTQHHVVPHPVPIKDAQGIVVGAINMLVDITERKEAEKAVAKLAAIVTSSDDAIISKNLQGIVTSWNQSAERLFGYTAEEMIGQPVSRLIPPDRQDEEPHILARLARGEPIQHYETLRRRKDGVDLHISLSVSPVVDPHGRVIGASKIARDITEQKRVEEALRDRDRALTAANEALATYAAALADSNKELESFSYSVSHDLRAPLRTIDAFSRIVLDEHGAQLDAEVHRCLNIVRKAAGQAGELIDDLLELSRLGRQSMQVEGVDMRRLAQDEADALRLVQQGRTISLILGELPPAQGDRRLLKLVWSNLIGNAVKYTQYRAEATIEIGWMPDESREDVAVYYVKDNGVGFNMRYVKKLFGVFQRLHRTEEFDGTGVGLAIVQRVIHRHGGRVWAEGKVDGGATFYFALRKAAT